MTPAGLTVDGVGDRSAVIDGIVAIAQQNNRDTRRTRVVYGDEPSCIVIAVAVARVTIADGGEFAGGIIGAGEGVDRSIGGIEPEFLRLTVEDIVEIAGFATIAVCAAGFIAHRVIGVSAAEAQLIGVANLAVEGVVGVGGLVLVRIGDAQQITDAVIGHGGGLTHGIGGADFAIEGVVAVSCRIAQRVRSTGQIADRIIGIACFVTERVSDSRQQIADIVAVGGGASQFVSGADAVAGSAS